MIYVTHDQIEAMTLADRIAIMRGGQIMQLGSPDEIYGQPINKYVADFIGSPSMNFLEGNIKNGTFEMGELSIPLDGYEFGDTGAATEGAATMGIRPEHVVTGELVESTPFQVDVEVNLIEPTGSDTLVDCEVAGHHFRVRMDGQSRVSVGEKLRLGFAPARASLFDAKTELRL
jgi:multiple sugar transport system ATP-binding protein